MDEKDLKYLREALRDYHNTLESSLSRAINREEQGREGYSRYIKIMSELRVYADRKRISLKQAAKELSEGN